MAKRVMEKQLSQKETHDSKSKDRSFVPGDKIYANISFRVITDG